MNRPHPLLRLAAFGALALLSTRLFLRPRYSFAGKVVVITGGSRGLGLALARRFAQEGARLVLLARDAAELDRAAADVRRQGAAAVLSLACDLTDERQIQAAIPHITETLGGIDVLINNAGMITVGPLHTMGAEDFERSLALHFWAPFHMVRAALPHLQRSSGARIVNIASFGGKLAVPHMAPYCTGKFALVGFSDALRTELAELEIPVTTVCPGLLRVGSHVNAEFKGAHEAEYAWFATGAAFPGSAMSGPRAAAKIVEACRSGRADLVLTLKARAGVIAQALMPNTLAAVLKQVNRYMPHSASGRTAKLGWDSRGRTPPQLTRRADKATDELNGLRGHAPLTSA